MKKEMKIFILILFGNLSLFSQNLQIDSCLIYKLLSYKVEENITKYDSAFFLSKKINNYDEDYFPDVLVSTFNRLDSFNKTEIYNLNIKLSEFKSITNSTKISCDVNNIHLIDSKKYRKKYKKYQKKSIALCTYSNIGFYDDYAVVEVQTHLSYGRDYVCFYFFKKDKKWEVVFSLIELE